MKLQRRNTRSNLQHLRKYITQVFLLYTVPERVLKITEGIIRKTDKKISH